MCGKSSPKSLGKGRRGSGQGRGGPVGRDIHPSLMVATVDQQLVNSGLGIILYQRADGSDERRGMGDGRTEVLTGKKECVCLVQGKQGRGQETVLKVEEIGGSR